MFVSAAPIPPNSYELRLHLQHVDDGSRGPYVASAVMTVIDDAAELRLLTASQGVSWREAERALAHWCAGRGVKRIYANRLLGRHLHWQELGDGRFVRQIACDF